MMKYDCGEGIDRNFIVAETGFDISAQGKGEAIFCLGNGRMGVRSATEENYRNQTRGMFIVGTFNRFAPGEFNELPNCADLIEAEIKLDGVEFDLSAGTVREYRRQLNLRTGELTRRVDFISATGAEYELCFRRFVSLDNLRLIGQEIRIVPKQAALISILSGINGRMTNSGVQHFEELNNRIFDRDIMQSFYRTNHSGVDFIYTCNSRMTVDGAGAEEFFYSGGRRHNKHGIQAQVAAGAELVWTKFSTVVTSRDPEFRDGGFDTKSAGSRALEEMRQLRRLDFQTLLDASAARWQERWEAMDVHIDGDDYSQLAIRFAEYHVNIMAPVHDDRCSIGAKGLSGEGYFGHAFWDNEIFIFPFFIYTFPAFAAALLRYRYNTLPGARRKAAANGYSGAMYPWESAETGEEETPQYAGVNPHTGLPYRIWTGDIEIHITSDVAFCIWEYFQTTGDREFMERYGYEVIFSAAEFWSSRLEWNEAAGRYEITDVIGPDEYKEHIDNNAFTNYFAHWTISRAIEYVHELSDSGAPFWRELDARLELTRKCVRWSEQLPLIYLPQPRKDGVIPQDDTYLSLREIDLAPYKNQERVGLIYSHYSPEEISRIQVSKQADILVLFYLLEDRFSREVKIANWNYYEPRTVHDSSLSLSTHCILACDTGRFDLAWRLFRQAADIDLGPDMHSSDYGIHAASLGGIWQCVVCGFGGVRMLNGKLRINPSLPEKWRRLEFFINWQGDRLRVSVDREHTTVKKLTSRNSALELEVCGRRVELVDEVRI